MANAREKRLMIRSKLIEPTPLALYMLSALTRAERICIFSIASRVSLCFVVLCRSSQVRVCRVRQSFTGTEAMPLLMIRNVHATCCPDPPVKVNDTTQIDLETGKMTSFTMFNTGNLSLVLGGAKLGRTNVLINRHSDSLGAVDKKDIKGSSFANLAFCLFCCWQTQLAMDFS